MQKKKTTSVTRDFFFFQLGEIKFKEEKSNWINLGFLNQTSYALTADA